MYDGATEILAGAASANYLYRLSLQEWTSRWNLTGIVKGKKILADLKLQATSDSGKTPCILEPRQFSED